MQMTFHDRAPLEKVRRLADGRIAAVAKFARSGVQQYTGAELGRPDLATVNVYRPESEVFDEAAMASFAHKAITLGHPAGGVTIDNWKQHGVGWTEGKVARDGDYVEIPLMLADAAAIRAYDSGEARELSGGYACELVWGDGIAPDGTPFQATQRKIRGDHIAQVPKGRAGEKARIGDSAMTNDIDQINLEVAQMRASHTRKFAFMGDRAPPFNEDSARLIAASKVQNYNAQVADAAREYALTGVAAMPATGLTADAAQRGNDTNAAMRNLARSNAYS
ncbi:DUF2213 domain-containing protein [Sphingopyxis sp. RIFCSPHIGHO2_12_FULL_65_19]|uniref:DUF2213 domain-containing protein n=1 Tax=Sphingopyxis sp. RIFCSPHIGHO2_12_FULL_65_19 TaxID=1802172 RepID=UPI000B1B7FCF|nr:DUF2213 domain-containing protein [Sphingopyxis sp. RIFCSPHIGHO2_12_FULL_65_19]